jgi:hypothetical protein
MKTATTSTTSRRCSASNRIRNTGNGHKSNGNGRHSGNGNGHLSGKRSCSGSRGPCAADIELQIQRWQQAKADAKALYNAADAIEQEVIAAIGGGGSLQLPGGQTVTIDDNFIDKNGAVKTKAYTVAGVKRFEINVK